MLTNVMFVTLFVTDLDAALDFYTGLLGLEKRVDQPALDGRFLTVGVPGSPLQILLWPVPGSPLQILLWPGDPDPGPPTDANPSTFPGRIFLQSDDLRKEFEVLRARGVAFEESEPIDYEFGVRATAVDPDGNRISLRELRNA